MNASSEEFGSKEVTTRLWNLFNGQLLLLAEAKDVVRKKEERGLPPPEAGKLDIGYLKIISIMPTALRIKLYTLEVTKNNLH